MRDDDIETAVGCGGVLAILAAIAAYLALPFIWISIVVGVLYCVMHFGFHWF